MEVWLKRPFYPPSSRSFWFKRRKQIICSTDSDRTSQVICWVMVECGRGERSQAACSCGNRLSVVRKMSRCDDFRIRKKESIHQTGRLVTSSTNSGHVEDKNQPSLSLSIRLCAFVSLSCCQMIHFSKVLSLSLLRTHCTFNLLSIRPSLTFNCLHYWEIRNKADGFFSKFLSHTHTHRYTHSTDTITPIHTRTQSRKRAEVLLLPQIEQSN